MPASPERAAVESAAERALRVIAVKVPGEGNIMEARVPEAAADGRPYVVEVSGDVDIATVDDLEGSVIRAVESGGRPVVIDLSECPFIDSSGIRLLIRAHRRLRADDGHGQPMVVVARDHVAKLLRLTAVDKVLPVVDTRAEVDGLMIRFPQGR